MTAKKNTHTHTNKAVDLNSTWMDEEKNEADRNVWNMRKTNDDIQFHFIVISIMEENSNYPNVCMQ